MSKGFHDDIPNCSIILLDQIYFLRYHNAYILMVYQYAVNN